MKALKVEPKVSSRHSAGPWLQDILAFGEEALAFLSGKSQDEFRTDRVLQAAVERNLGIIGEAVKQWSRLDDAGFITDSQAISRFRDLLVHRYWDIDPDVIWKITVDHLPILLAEVQKLLDDEKNVP